MTEILLILRKTIHFPANVHTLTKDRIELVHGHQQRQWRRPITNRLEYSSTAFTTANYSVISLQDLEEMHVKCSL